MTHYYAYDTNSTVNVSEPAQIQNAQITLRHIPKPNSITIANFTETTSLSPATGQFFCDYSPDTQFRDSNRLVHFNPADNGKSLTVNYVAIGTVFTADDANEIKAHLENASLHGGGSNASYQAGEGISISNDTISIKKATNSQLGGVKVDNSGDICFNSNNELALRYHPTFYLSGFWEDEMEPDTGFPDPDYFNIKHGDIIYHIPRKELFLYDYNTYRPFCKPQKFNRAQLVNVQISTEYYFDDAADHGDSFALIRINGEALGHYLNLPKKFMNQEEELPYLVKLTFPDGDEVPTRYEDEYDLMNDPVGTKKALLWRIKGSRLYGLDYAERVQDGIQYIDIDQIVVHYTTDKYGNIYDYENPTTTFTSSSSAFPTDPYVATFCYRYDLNQLFLFDGLNWLAI